MRKLLAICIFPVIVFAGCCKVECIGNEVTVSFEKLKAKDTDTVVVFRYRPGTNFSVLVDSAWMYRPVSPADTSNSQLVEFISGHLDNKVFLQSVNKSYQFSEFETDQVNCKCNGGKTQIVRSFLLNGVRKQGNNVVLE